MTDAFMDAPNWAQWIIVAFGLIGTLVSAIPADGWEWCILRNATAFALFAFGALLFYNIYLS